MKKYLIALDQGTTSSRAILFNSEGQIEASAQREFNQYFPQNAWVEHDPSEIWLAQSGVISEVMAKAGVRAHDIAAIGITNQRETTVLWDRKTGEPVYNAIVWQDRRTHAITDKLVADGRLETVRKKTGLLIDPYFSATKIQWILDNVKGARKRAEKGELAFGTIDSWLVWQLTRGKVHVTDASNASRTLLMNIHDGDWDEELLQLLRIPRELLPQIRSNSEVYAECALPNLRGVPIAGMAGDQQAALFGQSCFSPGMAKNTYGTGSFLLMNTGQKAVESKSKLLTTIAWNIDGKTEYALEGSVFISGAVVQWLRDGLSLFRASAMVEALARSVPDTGGVYFVPAFAGLGAPHWDPTARGVICGLTRGTTDAHIARAALEAIALQSYDVLNAMARDAGSELVELRVDGGATANDLLMQIQADILQKPVIRPVVTETTALGAAYLAGLAVGYFKDKAAIASHWAADKRFTPQMPPAEVSRKLERWQKAVERAKGWAT